MGHYVCVIFVYKYYGVKKNEKQALIGPVLDLKKILVLAN